MTTETTFDYAGVEAALCIWEWILDHANKQDATEGPIKNMNDAIEQLGYGQMRMNAAHMGPVVSAFYDTICAKIGEDEIRDVWPSFDWDFIPEVMHHVDWLGDWIFAAYRSDVAPQLPDDILDTMVAEYHTLKAAADKGRALSEYQRLAWLWSGRIWGYPDLASDASAEIADAFEAGDSDIEKLVTTIGEELDLSTPDEMTAEHLKRLYPIPKKH